MKRVVTGQEMATFDKHTISEVGIPSLVLMERAALACVDVITREFDMNSKITVMCGPGNNGADGVAIARILRNRHYHKVSYYVLGDEAKYTEELLKQISTAEKAGVKRTSDEELYQNLQRSDLIVDAIFGIGIKRNPSGEFFNAIMYIFESSAKVLSVDIPSGICADTGRAYTPNVEADYTVTFQNIKKGHLLSSGYLASGNLTLADIGIEEIPYDYNDNSNKMCHMLEDDDIDWMLPPLYADENKGTRGKVLVIAGSESIYGAAFLSAKAAYRTGCGMVKIYSHDNNMIPLKTSLPEALFASYTEYKEDELKDLLKWADTILIGPGLSTNDTAVKITEFVIKNADCDLVVDADALNIIASHKEWLKEKKCFSITLTPHLKEMSRLCGLDVREIEDNMEKTASDFCKEYGCSMILKNFTSFIYTEDGCFINTTGNEGMATAGSGDVLAGITASLIAQGGIYDAPAIAAYIHGKAGEKASEKYSIRSMMASDIIEFIKDFV